MLQGQLNLNNDMSVAKMVSFILIISYIYIFVEHHRDVTLKILFMISAFTRGGSVSAYTECRGEQTVILHGVSQSIHTHIQRAPSVGEQQIQSLSGPDYHCMVYDLTLLSRGTSMVSTPSVVHREVIFSASTSLGIRTLRENILTMFESSFPFPSSTMASTCSVSSDTDTEMSFG